MGVLAYVKGIGCTWAELIETDLEPERSIQAVFEAKNAQLATTPTGGWLEPPRFDGKTLHMRRAKYYRLTRAGRTRLRSETENWSRLSAAITSVLGARPEEA